MWGVPMPETHFTDMFSSSKKKMKYQQDLKMRCFRIKALICILLNSKSICKSKSFFKRSKANLDTEFSFS